MSKPLRGDRNGIRSDQDDRNVNSLIQGGQNMDCELPSQPNCERMDPGGTTLRLCVTKTNKKRMAGFRGDIIVIISDQENQN